MSTLAVGLVGVGAGIAAAVLVGQLRSPGPRDAARVAKAPPDRPASVEASGAEIVKLNNRLALVERALANAEDAGQPADEPESQVTGEPKDRPAVVDDVAEEKTLQRFVSIVDEFSVMPPDSAWGSQAVRGLQSDLATMAKKFGFDVQSVQCKDHLCMAEIASSSQQAATQHVTQVAQARYSVRCDVEAMMKVPSGQTEGISSTVIFTDCR
ncbi:hypothetical protein WME79_37790 [Sorangium sp. So ce726]|uniref:hypothetical protein n=1 Tax=Sorangium sp. So ce726 TaxID=3133319 RepID=UPI003F62FD56